MWAWINLKWYLDSHDSICFDVEHFIDTSKVSSTNFSHVLQVFSCEIVNLIFQNERNMYDFDGPTLLWFSGEMFY